MIELTKVTFVVSGSEQWKKLIRIEKCSTWLNPRVICYFDRVTKQFSEQEVATTALCWSNGRFGNDLHVEETPEEIVRKIRLARATAAG